jgi:hypothetical protein
MVSPAKMPTRRTSGPASPRTSSSRPSSASNGNVLAEMNSPQTFGRGKRLFSTTATAQPARASMSAVAEPAGPPPMTSAS